MPTKTKIFCFYISSHGYGHAARASQIMAALPENVKLIARTQVSADFITRESGRKVETIPGTFDTGVLQQNNRSLDWEGTLKMARRVNRESSVNLISEMEFLRRRRVDLVVCDVPPNPLDAARLAGVPSVVIGNFTWVEIFEREAKHYPRAGELADAWREQYAMATLAIRTPPAFPMSYFPRLKTVEPVARRGKNRRRELLRQIGAPASSKLILMYFGTFGDSDLRLPDLPDTKLLTFASAEVPGADAILDPDQWHFPDVVASVDCVVAKPGYGTTGECMANGTPMIYHPRTEFAEYRILKKAIDEWSGGVVISSRDFSRGAWGAAIQKATALKPKKISAKGAAQASKLIMELTE